MSDGGPSPEEMGLTTKDLGMESNKIVVPLVGDPGFEDHRKIEWEKVGPRKLEYQTDQGQEITILGIAHSNNPDGAIQKGIRTSLQGYLGEVPDIQKVTFIEGYIGSTLDQSKNEWAKSPDTEEEYRKFATQGEMQGLGFLAIKAGIEVVSPECPKQQIFDKLRESGIPADQVTLYYLVNDLGNLLSKDQATMQQGISRKIYELSLATNAGLVDRAFTNEEIQQFMTDPVYSKKMELDIVQKALPKLNAAAMETIGRPIFQLDNAGNLSVLSLNDAKPTMDSDQAKMVTSPYEYPGYDVDVFKKIAKLDHNERDKYLLDQINQTVAAGKSPFIVYGDSHITAIESVLDQTYRKVELKQVA